MNAAEIIQVIEGGLPEYFSGLTHEVRSNLGTSHYRRLSDEELSRRITAVYRNLEQWIASQDYGAVRRAGEELGKRRFEEGIPLGQVVLALVLEENYLRNYLMQAGVPAQGEWADAITDFFEKTIYSTARGYEASLAYSNRLAQRATVPVTPTPAKPPSRPEPSTTEDNVEISRGGQIGEVAG